MASETLRVSNLCARRSGPDNGVELIDPFSYAFQAGRFYEITGDRSRGLVLHLLGLLCPPERGEIEVEGLPVDYSDTDSLTDLRNRRFGFVFSSPFLLPTFTVLENVAMPLFKIAQVDAPEAKRITEEALKLAGILQFADARIGKLDPVQQTQVAVARAIVHHPAIVIAEEVTTRPEGSEVICAILRQAAHRMRIAVIASAVPELGCLGIDVRLEVRGRAIREVKNNVPHG
jgi:ABC-type lipoprotein export system ATPase subunit